MALFWKSQSPADKREQGAKQMRVALLEGIRGTALERLLQNAPGQLIRLNLHEQSGGAFSIWARDGNGLLLGQATISVPLNAAQLAQLGATAILHVCMYQIASELRSINKKLAAIKENLDDKDEVEFQQVLAVFVSAMERNDKNALSQAELDLRKALAVQMRQLVRELQAMPDIRENMFVRLGIASDRAAEICRSLLAQEARLQGVFAAFSTLTRLWDRRSRDAARSELKTFNFQELSAGLLAAKSKAKRISTDGIHLAAPWAYAHEAVSDVANSGLKLEKMGFGRQSTLIVVPRQEILEVFGK